MFDVKQPEMGLEAAELARWTRFAAKGGIGKCTATCDCVAESADDLMFLKDDEVTVLLQLPDLEGHYLGYCEGVVGRFSGKDVHFHTKLKKPVMTKRSSSHSRSSKHQTTSANLAKSPPPSATNPATNSNSSNTPSSSLRRIPTTEDFSTSSSRSETPVAQSSPSSSVLNSPTTSTFSRASSSAGLRNSTSGGGKFGPFGSRDFHFPSTSSDGNHVDVSEPTSAPSFSALGATSSSSTLNTIPSSTHQVPPQDHHPNPPVTPPSSPPRKQSHVPAPLNLESPTEEAARRTAPLRINKRAPNSPPANGSTSPLSQQSFNLSSKSSIASLISNEPFHNGPEPPLPSDPILSDGFSDLDASIPSIYTQDDPSVTGHTLPLTAPPSALDTSATLDSAYEDLEKSHPGRFSRFSIGPSLAISNLLGMMEHSPLPSSEEAKEREQERKETPISLSTSPVNLNGHVPRPPSLSEAARGKVDEATLASTQAQVGIGLSLLQDLVGGMGSDSDSDSDYDESPRKVLWTSSDKPANGSVLDSRAGSVLFGPGSEQPASGPRVSIAASEDSTIDGLTYGSTDDGHDDSPQSQHMSPPADSGEENPVTPLFGPGPFESPSTQDTTFASPATSPTTPSFPFTTPPHQHQSLHDPAAFANFIERERRPSLAHSVVSGTSGASVSARSAASSSWDADIYDNYRYSRFSMANGAGGGGRPSMDSVRPRTESRGQASRKRSESASTGLGQSVVSLDYPVEDLPSRPDMPMDTSNNNTHMRDTSVVSVYTQNSRLSTLSMDVAALSLGSNTNTAARPPPLSIPSGDSIQPTHSPLLHTNWSIPSPPMTGALQTALPPLSMSPESPHPGFVVAEGSRQFATSPPQSEGTLEAELDTQAKSSHTAGGVGLASTLRHKVETDRKSSLPPSEEEDEVPNDGLSWSEEPSFNGNIVAENSEEIPSKLDLDNEDSEYEEDDTFVDERRLGESAPLRKLSRDSISPEPVITLGRLAPLVVANRTPSPSGPSRDEDDEPASPLAVSQPPVQDESVIPQPSSPNEQVQAPPASHLRTQTLAPNLQGRRSIFLPHPNAPKPLVSPTSNLSPNVAASPAQQPPVLQPMHPPGLQVHRPLVQEVIRIALSTPPRILQGPPGRPPIQLGPTIFGQTEVDLYNSYGPVPIAFTIDPRPGGRMVPRATAPGGVLRTIGAGPSRPDPALTQQRPVLAQPTPQRGAPPIHANDLLGPPRPAPATPVVVPQVKSAALTPTSTGNAPLPRSNFTPKVPAHRPRSRSFSGFNSSTPEGPQTSLSPEQTPRDATTRAPRRTLSSSVSAGSLPGMGAKSLAKSSPLRPSPLSLSAMSANNRQSEATSSKTSADSSKSPLSPNSPLPNSPTRPSGLRSNITISTPTPSTSSMSPSPNAMPSQSGSSENTSQSPESSNPTSSAPNPPPPSTRRTSGLAQRISLKAKTSRATLSDAIPIGRVSMSKSREGYNGSNTSEVPEDPASKAAGTNNTSSGVSRQTSLRAKMSLPNLRKVRNRSEDDNDPAFGIYDRDKNSRTTFDRDRDPNNDFEMARELVQVQDMEFEFVRPNIAQLQVQARASSDSLAPRREGSLDSRLDGGSFLRAESPAASTLSSAPRSPVVDLAPSPSTSLALSTNTADSGTSIEAHRQREAKWVTLMSSSPSALSRKSKKVKKLLLEGVPSSVRYLIWSYLTDGKGRAVKGVYEQLCKRGEVSKTDEITGDISRLVQGGLEQFRGVKDTVVVLLQAYFAMVPDVQYSNGLVKIAGQLLVLAPEEDAFWIFTSIMDTHIRPYFSFTTSNPPSSSLNATTPSRSTQLEVDASLYARALENNDALLSKKLFVELGIPPGVICQPWLSSLFVGVFPPDHVHRIWDIFLHEGVPFLLRIALALTLACRRFVITAKTDSQALAILAQPPPATCPSTPDALLNSALVVKLKDDDVRKQRLKMGNIVKRQTQASQGGVGQNGISLPRS